MSGSNDTTVHLRVSVEANQGSRKSMEDYTSVTIEPRQDRECFFAVFDGHGGHQAAAFARQNLWKAIQKQKDFYSSDPNEVGKAIKRAFVEIHTAMWKERDSWPKTKYGTPSTAGTTASVVIMRGHQMFVANVGDSRVVLAQDAGEELKAVPLTGDHKPEDPLEAERIKSLGGQIGRSNGVSRVAWNRVSQIGRHRGPVLRSTKMESVPFLAIARSLGDLWSFNPFVGDFLVSPVPDVHYRLVDPRRDKFVVLASDGLWNAMKNKEVVHFIDNIEKNVFDMDWRDDVTHRLTCRALAKWRERHIRADNTSAIVVFFDEHEKAIPPYIPYSPPSDTETELGEATPSLSRSNSSTTSSSSDDIPKLQRDYAFYGKSSFNDTHRDNKRQHSQDLDSETETKIKRIVLSDD